MSPVAASFDVVCPRCAGRAAVGLEHSDLPLWACPFCSASNPMPPVPEGSHPAPIEQAPANPRAGRITVASAGRAAAAVALVIVLAASFAAQSTLPRATYRTAEGVRAALQERGLRCAGWQPDPVAASDVRESGSCFVGSTRVWLATFSTPRRRDVYLRAHPQEVVVVGRAWVAQCADVAVLRAFAARLGGRVVTTPARPST